MDAALSEIARVLKPGGQAWISEPVFAGELNEVFRLFHNEEVVRETAFGAILLPGRDSYFTAPDQ